MSYILDALKKSQQQKEQQVHTQSPLFASTQTPSATENNTWVWLIASAILLICSLFIWLIYQQIQQTNTPIKNPIIKSVPTIKQATTSPQKQTIAKSTPNKQTAAKTTKNAIKKTKTATKNPAQTTPKAPIETLRRIPKLNINSHIYSTLASKRKVTINSQEYQEGDWITDEVQLHEITQHGIRLKISQWFIDIGRSQGWQPL